MILDCRVVVVMAGAELFGFDSRSFSSLSFLRVEAVPTDARGFFAGLAFFSVSGPGSLFLRGRLIFSFSFSLGGCGVGASEAWRRGVGCTVAGA